MHYSVSLTCNIVTNYSRWHYVIGFKYCHSAWFVRFSPWTIPCPRALLVERCTRCVVVLLVGVLMRTLKFLGLCWVQSLHFTYLRTDTSMFVGTQKPNPNSFPYRVEPNCKPLNVALPHHTTSVGAAGLSFMRNDFFTERFGCSHS